MRFLQLFPTRTGTDISTEITWESREKATWRLLGTIGQRKK